MHRVRILKKHTTRKSHKTVIQEILTQLNKLKAMKHIEESDLAEVKQLLDRLKKRPNNTIIQQMFNLFNKLMFHSQDDLIFNALDKLIFNTLTALAELAPKNTEDPISFEEIQKDDAVFISSGHQLSVKKLFTWHESRPLREQEKEKALLNPLTNKPFNSEDREHIYRVAGKILKRPYLEATPTQEPINSEYNELYDEIRELVNRYHFFSSSPFQSSTDFGLTVTAHIVAPLILAAIGVLASATMSAAATVSVASLAASGGAALVQQPNAKRYAFHIADKAADVANYSGLIFMCSVIMCILSPPLAYMCAITRGIASSRRNERSQPRLNEQALVAYN